MDSQTFLQQLQIVLDRRFTTRGSVKAATDRLQKEFYPHPESLGLLLQLVTSHDDPHLRQLAAVEARSLVHKHWNALQADKKSLRTQLLTATMAEDVQLVRHAASRVISAIAKIELADGEWADLPPFLQRAATSGTAREREVGTFILFTTIETMGDGFMDKFTELLALFARTIRDPESAEVRINTMLALSKLAMLFDEEEDEKAVKAFQNIFPDMVKVLQGAIDANVEDRTMQAFEVFQTLLGCDPQLMSKHLKDFITFMIQLSANTELSDDTRVQAISFLMQCVKYRRLKVQGFRLGEQMTTTSLQIVTELGDAAADDDDITPPRSALGLIDMLAQSLPPSQVVVPLLHALSQYVNSQDADYRQAGILALGMCVEGAPEFVSTQLKEIIPLIVRLLEDQSGKVRQATLHTISRLADDLPEDAASYHEQLMPSIVKNLQMAMSNYSGEEKGMNVDMMKAATAAIDSVVSGMDDDDVKKYLSGLMPMAQQLMKHPDLKIKALTAGAIGSLAASSGEAFQEYLTSTMNVFQDYVTIKENEEELNLRASVTDAIGEMAGAVGGPNFKQYVRPLMQSSEENLHLDHSKLKETTYILWGALARAYEEEFSPFLPGVMKGLFDCLEQEEKEIEIELGEDASDLLGKEVTISGQKVRVAAATDDEDYEDDDGIEDVDIDDDDAWADFDTVTPMALEKEIAIEAIGQVCAFTKKPFLPYLQKTVETLAPMLEHAYEGVRKAVVSTLYRAYATLWEISEKDDLMGKWKPGLPLQTQPTDDLKKMGEMLLTQTLSVWVEEDDAAIVTEVNRSLSDTLKMCGPALISNPASLKKIVETVTLIIHKEHPCQQDDFDNDLDPDAEGLDESPEMDWLTIDTALDVVSGLAVALGPQFPELWKIYEKSIMTFVSSSEGIERSAAVGVLAECITGMGAAVTPYTSSMLKVLLKRLSDEHQQTKSNAAYAIGRLCENTTSDAEILKAYPSILAKLEPLLHIQGTERMQDNAAGCVSRMILKHKDAIPIKDVLPVLVGLLPLKKDYEENEPIYNCIAALYKVEDPTIRALTPQLIPVFKVVLAAEGQLSDETKAVVVQLAQYLKGMNPQWDCGV